MAVLCGRRWRPYSRLLVLPLVAGFFVIPVWVHFFDWYRENTASDIPTGETDQPALRKKSVVSESPTKVIWVLSYMRSGSSYISRSLFDVNPDVFFVYEPLASLYVSMYGLSMDMAVTTDILTARDGTPRQLPPEEAASVQWALNQVFTCKMTSFTSHMMGHVYWSWTRDVGETFYPCLSTAGVDRQSMVACWSHLKVCGSRLGQPNTQQAECNTQLWEDFYKSGFKTESNSSGPNFKQSTVNLTPFHECWSRLRPAIKECAHHFEKPCQQKSVVAVKTVRASMEMAEPLLAQHPNLYILYLYRDPRSVVCSRAHFPWSQGLYDGGNITLMARVYCQRIWLDYRLKTQLESKYPSRILTLTYEEFAENSMRTAKLVYDFLKLPFPEKSIWDYLMMRRKQKDPLEVRDKWKQHLTGEQVNSIERECAEFAKEVQFDWNKT